jgi:hypothetical protein
MFSDHSSSHEWHRWVVGSPNSERCVRVTWVEIETQLRARGYCKAGEFKGAYPRWCLSGAKWAFEGRSIAHIVYVCVCVAAVETLLPIFNGPY